MNTCYSPSRWILVLGIPVLAGCSSIDFDYPRTESQVIPAPEQSDLAVEVGELEVERPRGDAGFYPVEDGINALSARLLLAQQAEVSIDTQYYLIKTDVTSKAFLYALLQAADRGVRVRLLLDDVFTSGYDAGMAALDSHPNFSIRIFNPFARGAAGRGWSGISDFGRVNRRMHTKSFTVDNLVTIIGGRNIADEYFGAREDAKFGDLDVIGIGPVSAEVSAMFNEFWNHETALPLPAFADMPDDPAAELVRLREDLAQVSEDIQATEYAGAVRRQILEFMSVDANAFEWSPYKLVYDSPDKGDKSTTDQDAAITPQLRESLLSAEQEVIVLSPYFVPRKSGVAFFSELVARGVRVIIVTNSLAANNHAAVHGGYAPSRKKLLKAGVKLYEVRSDAEVAGAQIMSASGAKATMHTKAFLVDRKEVFIGSFNFDPRSVNLNTESGLLIRSTPMATQFGDWVYGSIDRQAYELFLDEKGRLRWRTFVNGEEVIYKKEPESTFGQRFTAGFMRIVPVHEQL